MTFIDIALLIIAILFAVSGFRQGFITSVMSFVGFFGGAALGAQFANPIAKWFASSASQVVSAITVVIVFALLGQLLAVWAGAALRQRITWRPARTVDSALGAGVSAITVLLVAWMVATPLAASNYPSVSSAIRQSEVVRVVDDVVPDQVRSLYTSLQDLINQQGFPEVFGPLVPTHVRDVIPPDPRLVSDPIVKAARPSILKITGIAPSCSRRIEGSGFVFAPEHVMTNAHVVAGVHEPKVEVRGERVSGQVVIYDPDRDVAVIYVPGLRAEPLDFAPVPAAQNADAIIAGYPQDGPFFVGAARVRDRENINGPNIYNDKTVIRQAYTIRGSVRSGNSGGPLLAPNGKVYGVIFAAALDDRDTGFALTAHEVATDAAAGADATSPVGTGSCD